MYNRTVVTGNQLYSEQKDFDKLERWNSIVSKKEIEKAKGVR